MKKVTDWLEGIGGMLEGEVGRTEFYAVMGVLVFLTVVLFMKLGATLDALDVVLIQAENLLGK